MTYGRTAAGGFRLQPDADGDVREPNHPVVQVDWFAAHAFCSGLLPGPELPGKLHPHGRGVCWGSSSGRRRPVAWTAAGIPGETKSIRPGVTCVGAIAARRRPPPSTATPSTRVRSGFGAWGATSATGVPMPSWAPMHPGPLLCQSCVRRHSSPPWTPRCQNGPHRRQSLGSRGLTAGEPGTTFRAAVGRPFGCPISPTSVMGSSDSEEATACPSRARIPMGPKAVGPRRSRGDQCKSLRLDCRHGPRPP